MEDQEADFKDSKSSARTNALGLSSPEITQGMKYARYWMYF